MSIILKTDPKELLALYAAYRGIGSWKNELESALAAHAMQMAIDGLYAECKGSYKEPTFTRDAIYQRAAANLARLMGEGHD
jgi:hypothetical protein